MHERVDWGLAALRAGNGKVSDHLPPWYEQAELDDEGLWGLLDTMSQRRYPEAPNRGR